jgi:tetratricopeptide (TPR) repeat protein
MKLVGILVAGLFALSGCPNQAKNDSSNALNAGNKAFGAKQYEEAINSFEKSVEKNRDNHLAWYGMGLTYIAKQDYSKAVDALEHTVQLAPDQGMYQMWYGVAEYEKAVATARDDQAKKQNKKPEEIDVDLSAVSFEKAQQSLQEAVKLIPQLWRAHYYLGRIARAQDKAKEAADEFTKAIQNNPREQGPYVALSELYRKWDFTDQAIQVASQGVANVPGANEVSEIWYSLGMGYADKDNRDKAIEAFTKALEAKKDNHKAEFERGLAYYIKNDTEHAKRDLEDFNKTGGASMSFEKQLTSKMLMDMAAKAAGAAPPPDQKQSPEDLVNGAKGGKGGKGGKKK